MASKTTLDAKNLEALSAERLAQLLIEVSTGNAAAKRKLRLALANAQSPGEAAREITKRLTSIARARSLITWKNRKALVTDLETQRRAIVEQISCTGASIQKAAACEGKLKQTTLRTAIMNASWFARSTSLSN